MLKMSRRGGWGVRGKNVGRRTGSLAVDPSGMARDVTAPFSPPVSGLQELPGKLQEVHPAASAPAG